jgi:hypothetical protein
VPKPLYASCCYGGSVIGNVELYNDWIRAYCYDIRDMSNGDVIHLTFSDEGTSHLLYHIHASI